MQRCKDAKMANKNTVNRKRGTVNGKKIKLAFLPSCLLAFFFAICYCPSVSAKAINTPQSQTKYLKNILKQQAVEDYERSLLPESGCMTVEEYEKASKDIPDAEKVIPEYTPPKDIKMKYVPQPTYKLARYNNPPGSVELHIQRRFFFDRQENLGAVTSPNFDVLVYPVIYYYACNQCTAGDLFVVPLDKTLSNVSRVLRSNIVKRKPDPILSTDKDIREKFTFRTMTPVDFSADGTKLAAKEKIGNINDGIWQTNLWVYDFNTNTARKIPEIREAIKFYWLNTKNLALDEKRWDITPLGFDTANPDRIIVSAYGYTGARPIFLGNWSIDTNGERAMLISLFDAKADVSMNGYKVVQDDILTPSIVEKNEKLEDKKVKQKRKQEEKVKKEELKTKKKALQQKLKEIDKGDGTN